MDSFMQVYHMHPNVKIAKSLRLLSWRYQNTQTLSLVQWGMCWNIRVEDSPHCCKQPERNMAPTFRTIVQERGTESGIGSAL